MLLLTLTALASPHVLTDAGQARPSRPAALVVATPGVAAEAYTPLVEALEAANLDAWLVTFPPEAQEAEVIIHEHLPAAVIAAAGERRIAVVGHGPGGTLAALSVEAGAISPDALGMLGAPLLTEPMGLHDWLAARPLPDATLDLATLAAAAWQDTPALPLLLGEPLLPLTDVSPAWLATLQGWCGGGLSVDLTDVELPVWAGASGLDNIAPPEWVRPMVPATSFFRFGYLRFESADPDHADLLTSPRALRMLSRWAAVQLRTP